MRSASSRSRQPSLSVVEQVLPPPARHSVPFRRPEPPLIPPLPADKPLSIVWFRGHDLRIHDHASLDAAAANGGTVVALYVLEVGEETDGMFNFMEKFRGHHSKNAMHATATTTSSPPADALSHCSDVTMTDTSPISWDGGFKDATAPLSGPPRIPVESERDPYGPLSPNGGFALGRIQRFYLHHSLVVLQQQLAKLGVTLVLRRVECANDTAACLASVASALNAGAVFWNKRYKPNAHPVDEAVKCSLRAAGIHAQDFDSETLIPPDMSFVGSYDDFQSYTKFWILANRQSPPPRPSPPLTTDSIRGMSECQVAYMLSKASPSTLGAFDLTKTPIPAVENLGLLKGLSMEGLEGTEKMCGCVAGELALERFAVQSRLSRFADNKCRRDGMVTSKDIGTSRLSPHVRFGEISPRQMFYKIVDAGAEGISRNCDKTLKAAQVFLKNMSLREFGYYMLSRYPSAAYKPIMPEFEAFPWQYDEDGSLIRAWETGTTGFPIVDAAMRQLLREGWLHNRMRFLAASFFCKYLLLPWPLGAAHMVRTLVDGDEACNTLGWQWTAGCNSDSFPFSTLVNPLSLYAHTQSRKRAAAYVRRYVPELAMLPDNLIFTPWKASPELREKYKLSIIPLPEYNSTMSSPVTGNARQRAYYPVRLVTGQDARLRARRAMEVMRRIFAAQRRCRTIVVEQFVPDIARRLRLRKKSPVLHESRKRQRVANSTTTTTIDGQSVTQLDITGPDVEEDAASYVTETNPSTFLPNHKNKSSNGFPADEPKQPALKRQRTENKVFGFNTPAIAVTPQSRKVSKSQNSYSRHVTKQNEVVSSVQVEEAQPPPAMTTTHKMHREPPIKGMDTMGNIVCQSKADGVANKSSEAMKIVQSNVATANTMLPKIVREAEKCVPIVPIASSTATMRQPKRPRPTTPRIGKPADDRLSVKSLLSPNLTHDLSFGRTPDLTHQPPTHLHSGQSPLADNQNNGLPQLAEVATYQPGLKTSAVGTPDLSSSTPYGYRSPTLTMGSHVNTMGAASPIGSRQAHEEMVHQHRALNSENIFSTRSVSASTENQPAPLRFSAPSPLDNSRMSTPPMPMAQPPSSHSASPGHLLNSSRGAGPRNARKGESPAAAPPATAFDIHRAQQSAVFHPSISPVPLLSGHFQPQQHPSPQIMVPFRSPGNPMPIPHLHGTNTGVNHLQPHASQSYFGGNPLNSHTPQPGQQFMWYPALSPYVDFRGTGIASPMLPHVVHPMQRQAQHVMPIPYPIAGGNMVNGHADTGRVNVGSRHGAFPEANGSSHKGATSILERKNIVHRMAAMDYHDDKYGGKHLEQWQAIALHLLDQYEFNEDTDRETSKAYVRLCVLKDELRDTNPNGPRVTVNHCKEVFRILNLPVTGEWDRRGHGGVRGPYVYGCVKRAEAQVGRR